MTNLFTVGKTSHILGYGGSDLIGMTNKCMTYNKETGEALGVVGTDYQIMQPQECADLVEKVTGQTPNVRWDGSKMIMQAPIKTMLLPGDDEVTTMFTIINSFDGSSALSSLGLSFRLFCSNQLRMAFYQAKNSGKFYTIRHKGNWDTKVDAFMEACERLADGQQTFQQNITRLVQKKVTSADIQNLWQTCTIHALGLTKADLKPEREEVTTLRIKEFVNSCTETYESERDRGAPDSLWLAANAVTKYIQHNRARRGRQANEDRRFVDNAIGKRSELSATIMREALSLVSA